MSYNLEIREEACISIKLICDRFNDLKAQIADELYNVIINNLADEYGIYGAIKAFHYLGKQILEIKFIPYIENILNNIKKQKYDQEGLIISTFIKVIGLYLENGLAQSKSKMNQNEYFQDNYSKITKILGPELAKYSHDEPLLLI